MSSSNNNKQKVIQFVKQKKKEKEQDKHMMDERNTHWTDKYYEKNNVLKENVVG